MLLRALQLAAVPPLRRPVTVVASLRVAAVWLLLLGSGATVAGAGGPGRVLFVGNSLTYTGDVPGRVADLARIAGRPLETAAVVRPDFSLEDHWRDGEARRRIREGRWDVVVLQQGPSSLPESRAALVRWSRRFAGEIRAAGAEPALYMVWPGARRRHAFDRVAGSYRAAAEAVGGRVLPVGEAWQAAWRRDPTAPLYGPDGFHPSAAGATLAALTIYATLFDASFEDLPDPGDDSLPEPLVRSLRHAAAEAAGGAGRD